MAAEGRYPSFNVLDERDAWDEHTRSIVLSRLEPSPLRFLTAEEEAIAGRICALLVDDDTPEVIRYVVSHIDRTLRESPGEGQRKAGVPEAKALIRSGLKAAERWAKAEYGLSFAKLDRAAQERLLQLISAGSAGPPDVWRSVPQQELFDKFRKLTVEAYCSHPAVWSAIGYAGPAYPRGYVRTQLGQLDPWEAKAET